MTERLFKKGERVTSPEFREGWDRIFGKKENDNPGQNDSDDTERQGRTTDRS